MRVKAEPRVALLALAAWSMMGCREAPLAPSNGLKYLSQGIDEEPHNQVDLLFVIDNSEGMAGKQKALIAAFPSLTLALARWVMGYRG